MHADDAEGHGIYQPTTLLNAILSTLGQGASAVTAKLPASARATDTRTVVNRDHTLHAPTMDVQVMKTKLGRIIKPADSFEPPVYAKGAFVAVELNVSNTGASPLDGLDETELEIDGKYYAQDFDATFDLDSLNTFPMQPGDSGKTVLAFDVPLNVAVDALTRGEIVVPEDPDSSVDFTTTLGAIRLAEPTAEGGQGTASSPTPAPAPGVKPCAGSREPGSGRNVGAPPR